MASNSQGRCVLSGHPQNHLSRGLGFLTGSNGGLDIDYLAGKEVCSPGRPENLGIWLSMLQLNIGDPPETVCNCDKRCWRALTAAASADERTDVRKTFWQREVGAGPDRMNW